MVDDTDESDPEDDEERTLADSFGLLALALLAVVVVGLLSGWLFGRVAPEQAASALIADFVVDEPAPELPELPPPARCGVATEPVAEDIRVSSTAHGVTVVRYRPGAVDEQGLAVLAALAEDLPVLVAPAPELEAVVEASSWRRRMPLDAVNRELLSAYVTAFAGNGPLDQACG